ncbi:TPA: N-glycosylase/DNA lyase [Candidatus Micrarchaeota archaeon]|nr:N-glycosylase/DNA lyase [Candidatus Micrarchaeota archaeon]
MEGLRNAEKETRSVVRRRLREFSRNDDWFSELCFCILTANYTAEGGMRIQNSVDFSKLSRAQIERALRKHGYRFPKVRSGFIHLAKAHRENLGALRSMKSSAERREWLVGNVKGLGYKEASHFLRNVGYSDVAIIDRHILHVLEKYGMIEQPKSLTKRRYLEIEAILSGIADKASVSLGELDLYLWYMKTGRVLK